MKRRLLALAVLGACGAAGANDFPTQARVEFVLECMRARGGQTYDTLYPCVCAVDHVAKNMRYKEYTQSETLIFLYGTPGERGGVFRDAAPESRKRIKTLNAVLEQAEATCFVGKAAQAQ